MAIIYKIWNSENNKIYIGCTQQKLTTRWSAHKCAAKKMIRSPMYEDMRIFGIDKFFIEIIEECDDLDGLKRELHWIKIYSSFIPTGYNQVNPGNYTSNPNRPYPILSFRTNFFWKKQFSIMKEHGFSAREVIEIMFESLGDKTITLYSKRDNTPIIIDKNFLERKKR